MTTTESRDGPVGLVLAGGGARGAYEMGVLSALLPALGEEQRPRVLVGTSVGALNASFLAATAELPIARAIEAGEAIWREIEFADVLRHVLSTGSLGRVARYVGQFMRLPRVCLNALLDPTPLRRTLQREVPIEQIEANVRRGVLDAAAVVATSALTSRSVVFHCGGAPPDKDDRRAIDYVGAQRLEREHVLASASIPGLFPATHVSTPPRAAGWYFDGGIRLNTPIKPALALGAQRVIVIALNAVAASPGKLAGEQRPDALAGAYQLVQGLLEAPLAHDAATLARLNDLAAASGRRSTASSRASEPRRVEEVPYIFIAPRDSQVIGRLARKVFLEADADLLDLLRGSDLALLGRALAGGTDPIHGELLSYLFFAPRFARELMKLGREDAELWIARHCDDLWQSGPLAVASAH